jgi:acyl-CoA thioesterase-1
MKRLLALVWMAVAISAAEPRRVVILGDSIAAGFGIDPEDAYPALLQKKVEADGLRFKVINAGLSGDTTAGGLRRIDWLLRQPLDVLVIELGGNDGLRGIPVTETRANLQGIIDRARKKYPEAKIVIAGMKMPANMGETYNSEFGKTFSEIAKKNDAPLIPFLLEGVGGNPELNQPDRIHPTPAGHKIVTETVWRTLGPLLKGRASANATGKIGKTD